MAAEKQDWDTRAWVLGIVGGLVGGSLTAWFSYPPLVRKLHASHSAEWISGIAAILTVLVLPGLVSGLARRRTFLWGLVPLILVLLAVDVENWVESGAKDVTKNFWPLLAFAGACLILSSGPVSLFRWLLVRAQRRREAAVAFIQAQREAAAIHREGVWPPPPDYRP